VLITLFEHLVELESYVSDETSNLLSVLEFLKNNCEGQQCTAKVMIVEEQ